MGIFSNREKVSVATNVARVFSDKQIVPSSQKALIKALIQDGEMIDYLKEGLVNSFGNRAEDMYRYAEGHYAFGMPSGEFHVATKGQSQIQAILNAAAGTTVGIDYSHLGPANCLHMGWMKLISDYGYNPETNELTTLSAIKGMPVYLMDMQVVIPSGKINNIDPRALEQWGVSPQAGYLPVSFPINNLIDYLVGFSPVMLSDTAPTEQILIKYGWSMSTYDYDPYVLGYAERPRLVNETTVHPLTGFSSNKDYFHVRYLVGDVPHYWMYELGAGMYPSLDALFDTTPTVGGEFFPFTYFRLENTSMDWNKTLNHYKTSKEMLKRLGLDYQGMIDSIHKNPDISNVRQAMMVFAVPANTTHALEQRYLFEFFDELRNSQGSIATTRTLTDILASFVSTGRTIASSALAIQDTSFKMALSNSGIYKSLKGGVIGAVGSFSSAFETKTASFQVKDADGNVVNHTYTLPCHYYRKQIASGIYEEIQVVNLSMTYDIYEGYKTVGNGTANYLLVPIDRAVVKTWSIPEKETLYMRSAQYVFNSVLVTEVAWYASEMFQAIMLAAAFVMAVYTFGTTMEAYTALLSAGFAATEIIIWETLILSFLEGVVASYGISKVIQMVSPEIGIAIAVLVAAYAISGSTLFPELPFADNALSAVNSLTKGISDGYSSKIGDIQAELHDLSVEAQAQSEAISKAQDLLQTSNVLSPFTIFGESPEDYYRRTTYIGNVGQIAIDGVASYVERALRLPTLADTLGGFA